MDISVFWRTPREPDYVAKGTIHKLLVKGLKAKLLAIPFAEATSAKELAHFD